MTKAMVRFGALLLCILFITACAGGPKVSDNNDVSKEGGVVEPSEKREEPLPREGEKPPVFPPTTAFLEAVRSGNAGEARALLDQNKNLANARDSLTGETALIIAARKKDNTMFRLLLGSGANANENDNDGYTALIYCVKGGFDQGVDLLVQREDIAVNYQTTGQRETALHIAVETNNTAAVNMLLENRVINVNSKNINGKTAFIIAVEKQNVAVIQLFRNIPSIDVTVTNDEGVPPLLLAIKEQCPVSIISEILRFRNAIYSKDRDGRDAFAYQERYARNDTRLRELLENARSSSW